MANELIGNENLSNDIIRGQVYQATHDGEGKPLSHVSRAYISFSYGGKNIEEFGVLVSMGDRLNRQVYAEFEDANSNYDTIDGQYYWGTRSKENKLNFTLSTDGMTQEELEAFKQHFRPGIERELILSEHPNRAIMARLASPPTISMIPFEHTKQVDFYTYTDDEDTTGTTERTFNITTALYKGDIDISFVMDEPYWHGKQSYIPAAINEAAEGEEESYIAVSPTPDLLKISLEDHIPFQRFLPGNTIMPADEDEVAIIVDDNLFMGAQAGNHEEDNETIMAEYAHVNQLTAMIGVLNMIANSDSIDDISNETYLYYAGTAPSKPIMRFILNNTFDENGLITFSDSKPYVKVGDKYFYFTFPAIYLNYNKVVNKLNSIVGDESIIDLRDYFVSEIKEKFVRNKISTIIEQKINGGYSTISVSDITTIKSQMQQLFEVDNGTIRAEFIFNSQTGEATGIFNLQNTSNESMIDELNALYNTWRQSLGYDSEISPTSDNYKSILQNVGDMIRSKYLTIDKQCEFILGKKIDKSKCLLISSSEDIHNFTIIFKNMYL